MNKLMTRKSPSYRSRCGYFPAAGGKPLDETRGCENGTVIEAPKKDFSKNI